jgi:hypothetical protein
MRADFFPFRGEAGALVGKLVILTLYLHRVGLVIHHQPPETIRKPIPMPDLAILDHGFGLRRDFGTADLVQSLDV